MQNVLSLKRFYGSGHNRDFLLALFVQIFLPESFMWNGCRQKCLFIFYERVVQRCVYVKSCDENVRLFCSRFWYLIIHIRSLWYYARTNYTLNSFYILLYSFIFFDCLVILIATKTRQVIHFRKRNLTRKVQHYWNTLWQWSSLVFAIIMN